MTSTTKVRRVDFSDCGPRFEPAKLLAADAPGVGRLEMAQDSLSSSLLKDPRILNSSSDMRLFEAHNAAWNAWVNRENPPVRACVRADLVHPGLLVEIMVTAAR
jgi:Endoribonuclease L-PSP